MTSQKQAIGSEDFRSSVSLIQHLKRIPARGGNAKPISALVRTKAFARGSEIALIICGAMVGVAAGAAVSAMSWISKTLHSVVFGISHNDWLSASQIDNKLLTLGAPIAGGMVMGLLYVALQQRRTGRLSTRSKLTPSMGAASL